MKRISWLFYLILRWTKIIGGLSYYHQSQGLGKAFRPDDLAGYFNDLTKKTNWNGLTDEKGIPINVLKDGRKIYFVTTLVQKALGHWDKWLLSRDSYDKEEFLKLCNIILEMQDEKGGWPLWSELGLYLPSNYSAMTQGECISAFVRAWKLSGEQKFLEGANRAFDLMCSPLEKGGTALFKEQSLFLEEFPSIPTSSILNGWIFAMFGIYDFWITFKNNSARDLFCLSYKTLKQNLYKYDSGYWSYYDMKGKISSPFYHDLHISQLTALFLLDKDKCIDKYRERWLKYQKNWTYRAKAISYKIIQKLKNPRDLLVT